MGYYRASINVEPRTHAAAKRAAAERGMRLAAFVDAAVTRHLEPDPLWSFLKSALDVSWPDYLEPGMCISQQKYEELPDSVRMLITGTEPMGDGRLKVQVVSKDWALRVMAENYLRSSTAGKPASAVG